LTRLDAHLAGGFLSEEEAHERIEDLLERYREGFGADRGADPGIDARWGPVSGATVRGEVRPP
jgi:hypothetical protein